MADQPSADGGNRRRTLPLNELRRNDGGERQAPTRDIPERLNKYYHQDGNAYRSATINDKIEFVDRGHRMHGYRPISQFTIRSMVEIAENRGWKSLEITGDQAFKSRAYVEAASRGMEVKGYEPNAKDAELLKNRADRKEAKENPKVQAFMNADDKRKMTAAAKKFPELKDAFAARAAVVKHAETIDSIKGREQYVGGMVDRIALAVHRGEAIPQVQIKQEPDKAAAKTAGQER
ncbi:MULTISPECIES: LPD7 domain-containing protein [Xanthomonas]|uniref:LPD7 domain-containing protein n=1 Tax=Xanthomonas TaxID=338 RepID=UPI001C4894A8|nr:MULTISPECIES: LPD7 domain-containing protein [Xanthomonas]MBV6855859.1 hypothetical protein [Xanthomonas campestris pv. mirabilis]MBV6867911.1 hypothetical protein [Xanthomonas campestris pv. coriandri]MCE4330831.1 hypothetical protein [Xanthomonas campestris pv. coriandri]MEA9776970.1 LPD7 domain-containing protein [Xanthomonas campestris pv. raphani]